eukprot:Colp12_sorted_trinity150504_noHs@24235
MSALAAQHLLPGEGRDVDFLPVNLHREGGRGGVVEGQSLALRADPVQVRHAHSRGGAVVGEEDVVVGVRAGEVRELSVIRGERAGGVLELQVLDRVVVPALAEGLPVASVHRPLAQHVPHGHLVGAGVTGGHDRADVVFGHLQDALSVLDGLAQARLAQLRAVRAAQRVCAQRREVIAGALLAGPGGELGVPGLERGLGRAVHVALDGRLHGTAAHAEVRVDGLLGTDRDEVVNLSTLGQIRDDLSRHRGVEHHCAHRQLAARLAAQTEVRDVHVRGGELLHHAAQHARLVVVVEQQHVLTGGQVQREPIHLRDAQLIATKDGALDAAHGVEHAAHLKLHRHGVHVAAAGLGLLGHVHQHPQADLLAHGDRVDQRHLLDAQLLENALDHRGLDDVRNLCVGDILAAQVDGDAADFVVQQQPMYSALI